MVFQMLLRGECYENLQMRHIIFKIHLLSNWYVFKLLSEYNRILLINKGMRV
jgi:hypothetical protein